MLSRRARFSRKLRLSFTRRIAASLQPRQQLQRLTWGDVHFRTDVTHGDDRLLQPFGIGQRRFVNLRRIVLRERLQHDGIGSDTANDLHACQMVSVMNGIIGCARRSRPSERSPACDGCRAAQTRNRRSLPAGQLRYQSQNWFQVNSYRMPAAISKRKPSSASR